MQKQPQVINDVTRLNPVPVWAVSTPTTVEEVQEAIRRSTGPVSVGGGYFSMGGQTASPGSLHLDMRKLNQVVRFSPLKRTLRVQAGIRWCDIQRFIDPHDLSVKIMQTYANFTVGGSLSVNAHGRYVGLGPLILSVRWISVVLADGERVEASPDNHSTLFYGAIGAYGGLGVIVEAELDLADNVRVERVAQKLSTSAYLEHLHKVLHGSRKPIFHNADLYPPHYEKVRSVTWYETKKPVTVPHRLMPIARSYALEKYFYWAISETSFGKWRREFLVDPAVYLRKKIHWRNYEAGYDVAELEPVSRARRTFVLQEYFVPVARFEEFVGEIAEILRRHRVNVINISVRHALADSGSLLAWAREEVLAFVLYYKQRVRESARNRVAVWTRELIDAVIRVDGAYYLPYQAHATPEQFHRAYPRARELSDLKRQYDPDFRLRNVIWDKYYAPTLEETQPRRHTDSVFHQVFDNIKWHDDFYRFLQVVYRIYPEDRFHMLIKEACARHNSDEAIYRDIQERLPGIKPIHADLTYALPALKKQKQEMTRQTLMLLGDRRTIDGYLEIGSTGRYASDLRKHVKLEGPMVMVHDFAPTNSPEDILDRGQLGKLGRFVDMGNYRPIGTEDVADESLDVVTCFIGLHHAPKDRLDGFVRSIVRVLRPGGMFILRDHDVQTPEMDSFVSLVHTVFNCGIKVSWEENDEELRHFASIGHWCQYLMERGLTDDGHRLLQSKDPSANTLIKFVKSTEGRGGE